MTPIQASKQIKEKKVRHNLQYKRKKLKRKLKIGDSVRTADNDKTFFIGNTTIWSKKLYKITEINHDTISELSY